MTKSFLSTITIALVICWLFVLFESNSHGSLRIDVHNETLFLGLSILLAGGLISLSQSSPPSRDRIASDYLGFITRIGDKSLTLDQLAEKVGEETQHSPDNPGPNNLKPILSARQKDSLNRPIYEGKICLHNGRYSLPENPTTRQRKPD